MTAHGRAPHMIHNVATSDQTQQNNLCSVMFATRYLTQNILTRESDQEDKTLLLLSVDEPPKTRSSQCTAHMTVIHFVLESLESRLKSYFDIWRKQETGF